MVPAKEGEALSMWRTDIRLVFDACVRPHSSFRLVGLVSRNERLILHIRLIVTAGPLFHSAGPPMLGSFLVLAAPFRKAQRSSRRLLSVAVINDPPQPHPFPCKAQ